MLAMLQWPVRSAINDGPDGDDSLMGFRTRWDCFCKKHLCSFFLNKNHGVSCRRTWKCSLKKYLTCASLESASITLRYFWLLNCQTSHKCFWLSNKSQNGPLEDLKNHELIKDPWNIEVKWYHTPFFSSYIHVPPIFFIFSCWIE